MISVRATLSHGGLRKGNPDSKVITGFYRSPGIAGQILAYVFGTREDETFLKLKELLAPFGITHFYTDGWGAYRRHVDPCTHTVGKQQTQKIERKHITFRTRIKRLTRKTICFSRSILMHDLVIGLFINRYEFGYAVYKL